MLLQGGEAGCYHDNLWMAVLWVTAEPRQDEFLLFNIFTFSCLRDEICDGVKRREAGIMTRLLSGVRTNDSL